MRAVHSDIQKYPSTVFLKGLPYFFLSDVTHVGDGSSLYHQ
jgi:hypothetical protein